jgi:hypothetical protein
MGMIESLPPVAGRAADESLGERWLVLPGGVCDAQGCVFRRVRVRELTGADEERLFDRGVLSGTQRVSAFLAHAIAAVEGFDGPIDEAFADRLQLGDRDYLLLRLRQLDLGDAVHQVMRCPGCRQKVDVDLLISELPVRRLDPTQPAWNVRLDAASPAVECTVRLPRGDDQAAVETLALANPAAANTRLFTRLVQDVDGRGAPTEDEVRGWPLARRAQLSAWLEAHSPGPDLFLDLSCPHCQADMSYVFDLHGFFLPSDRATWTGSTKRCM